MIPGVAGFALAARAFIVHDGETRGGEVQRMPVYKKAMAGELVSEPFPNAARNVPGQAAGAREGDETLDDGSPAYAGRGAELAVPSSRCRAPGDGGAAWAET